MPGEDKEFNVPDLYPYIILCLVVLNIEINLIYYCIVMRTRLRYYHKGFMTRRFKDEHEKAFGEGNLPPADGFPDQGDGRYSDKLHYLGWYEINCAQRGYNNMIDTFP